VESRIQLTIPILLPAEVMVRKTTLLIVQTCRICASRSPLKRYFTTAL
jgi:hypothetical protein